MAPKKKTEPQPVATTNTIQLAIENRAKEVANQTRIDAVKSINSALEPWELGHISVTYSGSTLENHIRCFDACKRSSTLKYYCEHHNLRADQVINASFEAVLNEIWQRAFKKECDRLTAEVIAKSVVVLGPQEAP